MEEQGPVTAPEVSVVICTYSDARWQYLVQAVRSVQNQRTRPHEIIVVVDHNPGLLARVQAELPGVIVVDNHEPKGTSGAKNSGAARATGSLVAYLDDDAVAEPDWLERLTAPLSDPAVLGVGGRATPQWPDRRPRWFPEEFDWVVGCTHRGLPETVAPIRNPIGCNMVIRRQVFESFGGFYNNLGTVGGRPLGCEETEFCIRASRQSPGQVWLYQPDALVHHHVPPQRTTWRYFFRRCHSEGLSKALLAQLAGTRAGLASERQHALHVLPRAALRGLYDLIFRLDIGGLGRAAAIVLGLSVTASGYVQGSLASLRAPSPTLAPTLANGSSYPERGL